MSETEKICFPHPAPPPPPPISSQVLQRHAVKCQVVRNLKYMSTNSEQFSETCLKETRKLVHRLNQDSAIKIDERMFYCCVSQFKPIVQEGPQCGLVCLCMASQCFNEHVDVETVVEKAKKKKYTLKGEMFSAECMLSLGKELLKACGSIIHGNNKKEIVKELLRQSLIVVPYDRDCNNEPCFKSGRKAHWALLTGILFSFKKENIQQTEPEMEHQLNLQQDEEVKNLYRLQKDVAASENFDIELMSDIHVFAQQGKSLRTHLWPLEQLLQSNSQLTELDPEIVENIDHYMIPHGGLTEGLKDKVVCFQRIKIPTK